MQSTSLELSGEELCAIIEATHDALMRRVGWTVNWQDGPWRELPFRVAQEAINLLMSALAKESMLLSETEEEVHPEFKEMFSVPEPVMDLINAITLADDWKDVPRHGYHINCQVCQLIDW